MIKINNQNIDLIIQVEEYTNIQKIFDELTLNTDEILIICPELFVQRFVQFVYGDLDESNVFMIEKQLKENHFVSFVLYHKRKNFTFHFILLKSEQQMISHPIKGETLYNVGFNKIKIN